MHPIPKERLFLPRTGCIMRDMAGEWKQHSDAFIPLSHA
jgi:hypothetical protein